MSPKHQPKKQDGSAELRAAVRDVVSDPVKFSRRLPVRLRDRSVTTLGNVMSEQQHEVLQVLGSKNRVAIAKARQLGISTICRAFFVWKALTTPGYTAGLLSNKARGAKEISRIDLRFIQGLELVFGQLIAKKNVNEIVLTNGSRLLYFSGAAVNDRGYTMDGLHISEFAHVENGADLLATLLQSVPDNGNVVIESTPSHHGDPLHKIVQRAAMEAPGASGGWTTVFFPWFTFTLYRAEPGPSCTTPEHGKWDANQEAWRRNKISELSGDEWRISARMTSTTSRPAALKWTRAAWNIGFALA